MARLNKKWRMGLALGGLLLLMAATVPLAIWVTHTSGAQLENARRRCDRVAGATHRVTIQATQARPSHTDARRCDRLVITNQDPTERLIAFGTHDNHISYDGVSERLLAQGQNLSVQLIQTGTYRFHDHEHDAVQGTFTVTN